MEIVVGCKIAVADLLERAAVMDRDEILTDDIFATHNAHEALMADKEQSTTE